MQAAHDRSDMKPINFAEGDSLLRASDSIFHTLQANWICALDLLEREAGFLNVVWYTVSGCSWCRMQDSGLNKPYNTGRGV